MRHPKRLWALVAAFALLMVCGMALVWGVPAAWELTEPPPVQLTSAAAADATAKSEAWLTQEYSQQVGQIIEDFEQKWHSLEFGKGEIGAEITTRYAYRVYGHGVCPQAWVACTPTPDAAWSAATSVDVRQVRVLEYTPERIKALATTDVEYDWVLLQGGIVESGLSKVKCGVYVFLKEDGVWKLAGFFLTNYPRSGTVRNQWIYADDELRKIVGPLPEGQLCEW